MATRQLLSVHNIYFFWLCDLKLTTNEGEESRKNKEVKGRDMRKTKFQNQKHIWDGATYLRFLCQTLGTNRLLGGLSIEQKSKGNTGIHVWEVLKNKTTWFRNEENNYIHYKKKLVKLTFVIFISFTFFETTILETGLVIFVKLYSQNKSTH